MDNMVASNLIQQTQIPGAVTNAKFVTNSVNANHTVNHTVNHAVNHNINHTVNHVNNQVATNMGKPNAATNADHSGQLITLNRMNDLLHDIDPTCQLDEEVEDTLLQLTDDFVENIVNGACLMAKHRHVSTIEVKDVQIHLERAYNMWLPGFGTDELRPYKRSAVTEAHKQRVALIRRALKKY